MCLHFSLIVFLLLFRLRLGTLLDDEFPIVLGVALA